MKFQQETIDRIERDYQAALPFFGECGAGIDRRIQEETPELARLFLKYLYAYMPVSDVGAYEFETFLGYAAHGVFLLRSCPWTAKIPEEYFLHYVLQCRVNSEDITDCRRFFYGQVIGRLHDIQKEHPFLPYKDFLEKAVLEINNWCFEAATYRDTSIRTASPLTVYKGGCGRCGEESTLLVTVLRGAGIPARQIYVPRWSHSESNHAWVEAWLGDQWSYTGACEPEPVMCCGWFTKPASRAMMVHSRVTAPFGYPRSAVAEKDGIITALNHTHTYAETAPFTVFVKDRNGRPAEGALVRFLVLNSAEFFPIAFLETDCAGKVSLSLGLGELLVEVLHQGGCVSFFVDHRTQKQLAVCLDQTQEPARDKWLAFSLEAPQAAPETGNVPTPEQAKEQEERNRIGEERRRERLRSYYDEDYARRFEDEPVIRQVLEDSLGNFAQIREFLDAPVDGVSLADKSAILGTISKKDCRDISAAVLLDWLGALEYRGAFPQDIFEPYLLAGRIYHETATPYRSFLKEYFGERGKELVREPDALWEWIETNLAACPQRQYPTLIGTPRSVLLTKAATDLSRKVLFVAVCRTFGVPAGLDSVYLEPQYYQDGKFRFPRQILLPDKNASLTLNALEDQTPVYYRDFTLGRRQPEGTYRTLQFPEGSFPGGTFTLPLAPGEYRLITCDRMPDGSLAGKWYHFRLEAGEHRHLAFPAGKGKVEDFLLHLPLPEFYLTDSDGQERASSCFGKGGKSLLLFVEPGQEPTEHLFNEMLEIAGTCGFPETELHLILKPQYRLTDETYRKMLRAFPHARVWLTEFDPAADVLCRAAGEEGRRLPLTAVLDGSRTLLYFGSGYRVGSGEMVRRVLKS
ncbi:MAG: transglutaminase domain-containing protein [Clostridium sp.]|jgi:hypothetical protein|nr:transglutaminase domain-containing protein [Clostridium sp.]